MMVYPRMKMSSLLHTNRIANYEKPIQLQNFSIYNTSEIQQKDDNMLHSHDKTEGNPC